MKKFTVLVGGALLLFVALFVAAFQVKATHVDPVFVPDNPDCSDLGYDFGFKIDAQVVGNNLVFALITGSQNGYPTVITSGINDPGNNITINNSNGVSFDWSSTLGMDAVIVKAGNGANVYYYSPESTGDTGLITPESKDISHLEFCYDYEVDVSKTAVTSFTRTFDWTIDKSVTPDTWNLFTGDSGTSKYTVSVVKTGYTDSDWAVSGVITIENNTPFDAKIESVADEISGFGAVAVTCDQALPFTLANGGTLLCGYQTPLPDGTNRTNTATVTTDPDGDVGGNQATANVTFGDPTTVVNDSINVDDTNGGTWMFGDTGSVMYERTFSCDQDEGTHGNVATIRETGQSDDASVTVNCYALTVKKDAHTSFDRNWNWTIDKTGDQTALTLSEGQQFLVNYTVTLDATAVDSNFVVNGEIMVTNTHPSRDADLTAVSDLITPGDIAATVNCPATTVPAGGSLTCSYSAGLPNADTRTNTATATLQNYDFASDGTATADGTTDFSGEATVDFTNAIISEFDECVSVTDNQYGDLGTICATDANKTFMYSMYVGPYNVCGMYEFTNIAAFVTNDTGATGSDQWTVTINVPCAGGCTLTQGYWKTHSEYGPAPYDETWALLPNGADTEFFGTGQSYYTILNTPPKGGNAYLILAHQYIAAELNMLNGASIPDDVLDAWNQATALLAANDDMDLKGADARLAKQLAEILDAYNNGLIGPGHCSE